MRQICRWGGFGTARRPRCLEARGRTPCPQLDDQTRKLSVCALTIPCRVSCAYGRCLSDRPSRLVGRAAAVGDGLGLIGADERRYASTVASATKKPSAVLRMRSPYRKGNWPILSTAGERPLRPAGRRRAAAGDGLRLVSAGERRYRQHGHQRHEQAQYSSAHCLLQCLPGLDTAGSCSSRRGSPEAPRVSTSNRRPRQGRHIPDGCQGVLAAREAGPAGSRERGRWTRPAEPSPVCDHLQRPGPGQAAPCSAAGLRRATVTGGSGRALAERAYPAGPPPTFLPDRQRDLDVPPRRLPEGPQRLRSLADADPAAMARGRASSPAPPR